MGAMLGRAAEQGADGAAPPADRILPATRWLAAAIIPALVVAFVVLYPVPTSTGRWFAWEINPTMTPMVLGAAYLGGAWFFWRVLRGTSWRAVQAGFPPVALFAGSLGVATVIHWDKFNHDHLAFWLWAGLYFTTPLLVAGVWWRNRQAAGPPPPGTPLPPAARLMFAAAGAGALAFGLFVLAWPAAAIDVWPWAVSELTARVMGAVLLLGAAGLAVAADPAWETARLPVEVALIMLVLMLAAAVRARDQFLTDRPLTWLLGIGLAVTLAGAAILGRRMAAR